MDIFDRFVAELRRWPRRVDRRVERTLVPGIHRARLRRTYGSATPDPFEIVTVDPAGVDHLLVPHFWRYRNKYTTYVEGGDWDRTCWDAKIMYDEQVMASEAHDESDRKLLRFDDYGLFRSMKAHFREGVPWEDTEFYAWVLDNADGRWTMYDTPERVKSRLAELDELYACMSEYGYMSQREIDRDDSIDYSPPLVPPEVHEVVVDVGRDGRLILDDGRHRFMLAKILGVDEIPVRVLVRHRDWQEIRAEIADATSVEELRPRARVHVDHPDVDDVVSAELRTDREPISAPQS